MPLNSGHCDMALARAGPIAECRRIARATTGKRSEHFRRRNRWRSDPRARWRKPSRWKRPACRKISGRGIRRRSSSASSSLESVGLRFGKPEQFRGRIAGVDHAAGALVLRAIVDARREFASRRPRCAYRRDEAARVVGLPSASTPTMLCQKVSTATAAGLTLFARICPQMAAESARGDGGQFGGVDLPSRRRPWCGRDSEPANRSPRSACRRSRTAACARRNCPHRG